MYNIFENVKFGDKFITKDGRIAVFENQYFEHYQCVLSDGAVEDNYLIDGTLDYVLPPGEEYEKQDLEELDGRIIISKYKKPIDETELNQFIDKETDIYWDDGLDMFDDDPQKQHIHNCVIRALEYGIKIGYRKAKEE